MTNDTPESSPVQPPYWLLAELSYRCPLHCIFCYNPVDQNLIGPELSTDQWLHTLDEARALGAVQLGLSGGEPLVQYTHVRTQTECGTHDQGARLPHGA